MPDAATGPGGLDAEDGKLVTLARSTRARLGVVEGAAVRDDSGRTYAAGPVQLPSLQLTALQAAVAAAVASGATLLEAAAVVTADPGGDRQDLGAVRDLGGSATPVLLAAPDGVVKRTVPAG